MKPCIRQPGKVPLPHVHHEIHAENSSDLPLPLSFLCDGNHRVQGRSELLGDSKHSGFGLGDSSVCPDNPNDGESPKQGGSYLSTSWSYLKWCASLVPSVLRSRTPFASFLSQSIKMSKISSSRSGLASAFFPVPIPFFGVFGRMPDSSSASLRHTRHISRAIHVIAMALNFWHFGGHVCDLELLRMEPSRQHLSLFQRLRFLIKSDWPAEVPNLPKAGRKFPQLTARLSELSDCLTFLGPSSNPYEKIFNGVDVPLAELSPYRDLDPSRLWIKGTGLWDATEFLDDGLAMVYREPAVIRFSPEPSVVPSFRDSQQTIGELARLWDSNGLLFLHDLPVGRSSHVRVFNTLKSVSQDRQIGDRRAMNSQEAKVSGPSSDLPAGCDLTSLLVRPQAECVTISITDRSDFYHQFRSSHARAYTNTVYPSVPAESVKDTSAYALFLARSAKRKVREQIGDHLESFVPSSVLVPPSPGCLWVSFNSVLQGDHSGVEIATESHANLLRSHGLLQPNERVVASSPLRSFSEAQGLVIDDFFALSIQGRSVPAEQTLSSIAYHKAQHAYREHGLEGSPEKDLVIGAYVNGGHRATSRGLVTVGSPVEKRLGLSILSLMISQLQYTSDALHLCLLGGWTSILGFRRPLMSVLQEAFHVVDQNAFDASRPKLVHLSRKVATELVLLAVLMPLSVTDIAAPLDKTIYCTDASLQKGAILETEIDEHLLRVLYRTSISKGAYTKMLSGRSSILKSHDWRFEEEPFEEDDALCPSPLAVERPLAFSYEFIEVYAGSSKITKYLEQHGINCGPPLDLSLSSEFDVAQVHVISWLTFLVSSKKLRAFVLEPPCTTFSIMRRPRLRSKEKPLGFRPREEKTLTGNTLSCRGGQLLHVGARHDAFGLLETPYSSYMKHMPFWKALEGYECFKTVRCDSCRYGSPHLKSFRFLCLNIRTDRISSRCTCTSRHLQVQGSLTKTSAIYTDMLAESIALTFVDALRPPGLIEETEKTAFGLESLLVNEVMQSSDWKESSVWSFKKQSHINILEEAALYRLVCRIAKRGKSIRSIAITDSNVVKCATSKGRTSSKGLGPVLRKLCSLVLAAGIYLNVAYIPTRLNAADDPTRDHPVRRPIRGMALATWTSEDLFKLSSLGRFRRWSSDWLRLCIMLMGPSFLYIGDRSLYRSPWQSLRKVAPPHSLYHHSLDFDASLGFPGEGPFGFCFFCVWLVLLWSVAFRSSGLLTWTSFCFACFVPSVCRCSGLVGFSLPPCRCFPLLLETGPGQNCVARDLHLRLDGLLKRRL